MFACLAIVLLCGSSVFSQAKTIAEPNEISGLVLWLDAADANSITKDVSGKVSKWSDKSGKGFNAEQSDAIARPLYSTTAVNDLPGIVFNGSTTMMKIGSFRQKMFTAFVVGRRSSDNQNPFERTDGDKRGFALGYTGESYNYFPEYRVNGVAAKSPSDWKDNFAVVTGFKGIQVPAGFKLGFGAPSYAPLNGPLAEILIYERRLAAAEIVDIEQYLAAKWKISITGKISADFEDIGVWEKIGLPAPPEFPKEVRDIRYKSDADGTEQPALFYAPESKAPAPLLVSLHTWSFDYRQTMQISCAKWCVKNGWAYIQPDFRGPNTRPEATGSELAVKDITSAVDYAKSKANIDVKRIYLLGHSGGGYATLLMAGRAPDLWAAVSAWCPISDLTEWHQECVDRKIAFSGDIEKSCGGNPAADAKAAEEARKRSAITYLEAAKKFSVDLNAGINDGHSGNPVPISQSLRAFNLLAPEKERLTEQQIKALTDKAAVPAELAFPGIDPAYGNKKVLFRRDSGNVRITLFDGGHEAIFNAGLEWLAKQVKP